MNQIDIFNYFITNQIRCKLIIENIKQHNYEGVILAQSKYTVLFQDIIKGIVLFYKHAISAVYPQNFKIADLNKYFQENKKEELSAYTIACENRQKIEQLKQKLNQILKLAKKNFKNR